MSPGEMLLTTGSLVLAMWLWLHWLFPLLDMSDMFYGRGWIRRGGALAGVLLALVLFAILRRWSATDVRDDIRYLAQYWLLGSALLGGVNTWVAPLCGLSWHDDVCERRNPAALVAWIGVMAGFTLAYGGANIGDGPGFEAVLLTASMSLGALWLAWYGLEAHAAFCEAITVEHDLGAGFRLAGAVLGFGLVVGRGAAGDWTGTGNAIVDFARVAAPRLVLPLAAGALERRIASRRDASGLAPPSQGLWVGGTFVAAGLGYVAVLGPW